MADAETGAAPGAAPAAAPDDARPGETRAQASARLRREKREAARKKREKKMREAEYHGKEEEPAAGGGPPWAFHVARRACHVASTCVALQWLPLHAHSGHAEASPSQT